MNTHRAKLQILLMFISGVFILFNSNRAFAGVGIGLSNIFTLDTREDLPPDGNWQILSNKGDTYSEDVIIDNSGKVWAFYLRSPGKGQPVYMKILKPDGYVYKSESIIGNATALQSGEYQTVRACLNSKTGDVWVAIQGSINGQSRGYFMVYDSTGNVRLGPTFLNSNYEGGTGTYYPKVAADKNGKMWFVWQTDSSETGAVKSVGEYACYNSNGDPLIAPTLISTTGYYAGIDLAIDSYNRIWLVYERGISGNYNIYRKILENDASIYKIEKDIAGGIVIPFGAHRIVKADTINHRVWILVKNVNISEQRIFILDLDGDHQATVTEVGEATFALNELNRLEVIQFQDAKYRKSEYDPTSAKEETSWTDLFTNVHSFVHNGLTYNRDYEQLKVYLVQTDSITTKFYLEKIERKPLISVNPSAIDFDSVLINTAKEKLLQVFNDGIATLVINNIDSDNSQFSVDLTQFSLEPGERKTLKVTFQPLQYEHINANLTITSNDPDNPNLVVALSGVGRKKKYQKIVVSPDTLNFGTIALTSYHQLQLTISNTGEQNLYVDSIRVSDNQFTSRADNFQIPGSTDTSITISFNPTLIGQTKAALTIYNDDITNPAVEIILIGTGRKQTPPSISVSSEELQFGNVFLREPSRKILTIHNRGEQELEISSMTTSNEQFVPDITQISIGSGRSYELGITFRPTTVGSISGSLTISSNDPANPELTVSMSGTGEKRTEQNITISTDSLYFGGVEVGSSRTRFFWIKNTGELTLNVSKIESNNSQFSVEPSNLSLESGSWSYVYVSFNPIALGPINASLKIISNDPDSDSLHVGLAGVGEDISPAQIAVDHKNVDFGENVIDSTHQELLWVYNPGDLTLIVSNIYTNDLHFTVDIVNFTLAANSGRWLPISFRPTSVDTFDATLTFISNDQAQDTLNIPLHGVGRLPYKPQIYVFPSPINFGTVPQGIPKNVYLYIKNIGEGHLHISDIQITDNQFIVYADSFSLKANEFKRIKVTYTPSYVGKVEATINIRSDVENHETLSITVYGTGRALKQQELWVSNSNTIWNFGEVALGSQSKLYFQITNIGEQDLVISSIEIDDEQQFVTSNFSGTLAPNESRYQHVIFTPTRTGISQATMTINSNDPITAYKEISLQGVGRNLLQQNISIRTESLNYGQVPLSQASYKHLWIYNTGEQPLNIFNITTTDSQFSVNTTTFDVSANNRHLVVVSYKPANQDTTMANLIILSNDPDTNTSYVALHGRGRELYAQKIFVSPEHLDFGDVGLSRAKQLPLWVQNMGERELHIDRITFTDTKRFAVDQNSFSLQPLAGKYIHVTFMATRNDTFEAKLTIHSNDQETPAKEINLFGISRDLIPQTIVYSPNQLNFGQVGKGLISTSNISIFNQGEKTLQISNIAVDDTNFNATPTTFKIAPGDSQVVHVNFMPEKIDTYNAQLTIQSNDPVQEFAVIPLYGIGRTLNNQKISISTYNIEFDSVAVGQQTLRYFYIENIGEMPLSINSISSNDDQFAVHQSNFQLEPGRQQVVNITYVPVSYGSVNGKLTIISNDPDSTQIFINLSGVGRELKTQHIAVNPDSVKFDTVGIGQIQTGYLWIKNEGDEDLVVNSIVTSDTQFTIYDSTFAVKAGLTHQLSVLFAPKNQGFVKASLVIYSNDPKNTAYQVPLSGVGRVLTAQQILVSPDTLYFGAIPVNNTNSTSLFINNLGEDTLLVSNITTTDPQFTVSNSKLAVPSYNSRQIGVTFRPVTLGTFPAKLQIINNDPINDSLQIGMLGIGRELKSQQIFVNKDSIDFETIGWGHSVSQYFDVQNIGEILLNVTQITNNDTHFTVAPTNFSVAPGSYQRVQVSFTPTPTETDSTQGRAFTDTLTISSDATNKQQKKIILSGTGRPLAPPQILIEPNQIDFDTLAVKRRAKKVFHVINKGEGILSVTDIQISTPNNSNQFTIHPTEFIVTASDRKAVTITYSPTRVDTIQTTLTAISNDPLSPTYLIPVNAAAVEYNGPQIAVRPDTLHFGSILTGSQRTKSIYVSNDGPIPLNLTKISSTNSSFIIKPSNFQISSGESLRVNISFKPQQAGYFPDTLMIESNDAYSKNTLIFLTGTGILDMAGNFQLAGNWEESKNGTQDVLSVNQRWGWFLKDFYLYSYPQFARLNIAYNEGAQVYINGILAFDWSNDNSTAHYWTRPNLDILSYLILGRNRVAVVIFNPSGTGGFDCELLIDSTSYITQGDLWWYYCGTGTTPPLKDPTDNYFYSNNYGWTGLDSLSGSWSFEDITADTLYDGSQFGRRAIIHGASRVQGVKGYALKFDSVDDYADLEVNINNVPLTVEMWIYCYGPTNTYQTIFTNQPSDTSCGHALYLDTELEIWVRTFKDSDDFIRTQYRLSQNNWYFISTRFLDNYISVYVNGKRIANIPYSRALPNGQSHTFIGQSVYPDQSKEKPFHGIIDEVKIYNLNKISTEIPTVASLKSPMIKAQSHVEQILQFQLVPSAAQIKSGTLQYAVGGATTTKRIQIQASSDTTVSVNVPANDVTIKGLKYRFDLESNLGKIRYPEGNDTTRFEWLTVSTKGEQAPFKTLGEIYRMISVPYELNNKFTAKFLEDDFGKYDPYNWRLFKWKSLNNSTLEFVPEYWNLSDGFDRGQAMWLVTWDTDKMFDADSGSSAPNDDAFEIYLEPGWNQIADPFPFTVAWDSVQKAPNVSNLYYYNPNSQGYELNYKKLVPWEGYFVYNADLSQVLTITVPAQESGSNLPKENSSLAKSILSQFKTVQFALNMNCQCGKLSDPDNLLAVAEGASNTWDAYDAFEAPPIGNYVSLRVDNRDWKLKPGQYAIDIRAVGEPGYVWKILIDGKVPPFDTQVDLNFEHGVETPEAQEIYLFDLQDQIALNLKRINHYCFEVTPGEAFVRRFKVVVGDEEFISEHSDGIPVQPLRFELAQNYPNPFNPITTIRFSLPKKSHTTLIIYNILGQQVKTLVNGTLRAARHTILWDGTNDYNKPVSSGIYFIRLSSEEKVQVCKMTLLK